MAITMEQALTEDRFHDPHVRPCNSRKGPVVWRRNGATKTWKRQPKRFRIPVKFGLYTYDYITEADTDMHAESDCPVLAKEVP